MTNESFESIWSNLMRVPFRQAYANVGGVNTRYVEAGARGNPAVVFVHGIGGSWECFCANIAPFAEHFNVFALDCLGSGFTDKPEQDIYEMKDYVGHLRGFLSATDVEKTSLVGVSMGSWISINFAHAYPDMVERVVVCAASGMQRDPGHTPPATAAIASDRAKAIDDPSWENISNIFTDLMLRPEKRNADFIKVRQTVYQMPEMKGAMRRILALTKTENFNRSALPDEEWRKIRQPVLLVESTDDSEHFRKNTQRAHSLLQNSRIHSISNVAHWPQWEDPEEFNRVAIDFLRTPAQDAAR